MNVQPTIIPPETEEKIISRWKYSPINSISEIAKEFHLKQNVIHIIINNHLSKKLKK